MLTTLDVVNQCLAIMGEAPLNALNEDHVYKAGAINKLNHNDAMIQSEGWWFNTENLKLRVNIADRRVYLPTDNSTVKPHRNHAARYVQRGRTLYDLREGTDRFPDNFELDVLLVRRVPFEDLPVSVSSYIAGKTVLDFQNSFDGDQTKTRNLLIEVNGLPGQTLGLKGMAEAEHIRNIGYNFINDSSRLGRIRNVTHRYR